MTYTPVEMPIGTRAAHCTVCGEMFLSGDAFDIHRGIDKNLESIGIYDDLRQDAGCCMSAHELHKNLIIWWSDEITYRWGTENDIRLVQKMEKARDSRN